MLAPDSLASLVSFFPQKWSQELASAVANHLWQSTVFAVLAGLLTLALRNNRSRARYWLWFAASAKFLFPFSLLILLGSHMAWLHPAAASQAGAVNPATYVVMQEIGQPFDLSTLPAPAPAPILSRTARLRAALGGSLLPATLAAVWLAGVLFVLARWTRRWWKIAAVIRNAPTLADGREADALQRIAGMAGLKRGIALKALPISIEPGIFGLFRPVLLWPESISSRLDDAQLESVLAHEVCHVRRGDNITAALHMAVEAIFWFHPLVWWLEARLVAERETACDEDVLDLCGHARAYAESILKVCEFCIESPLPCVTGVTGADLRQRVAGILTGRALARMSWPKKLLLAAAALCAVAAPVVLGQASAAHRLMLAAINAVPRPLQAPAHTMLAAEAAPSSGSATNPSQGTTSAESAATVPVADDMSLGPAFEVATIRPGNRDDGRRWFGIRVDDSGHFETSAATLNSLIVYAYVGSIFKGGVALDPQAPKWANTDEFDINAKVDDAYMAGWDKMTGAQRADRVRPMARRLLVDRFKLKLRTEMRDRPVYALVQAKNGTKLKEVAAPPPPEGNEMAQMQKQMATMRKDPANVLPGQVSCPILNEVRTCIGKAVPMSKWPGFLMLFGNLKMDRVVVDETGLKGYYDFSFTLSTDADAASPMEQIQEQTGLRFEPRNIPTKTYVIISAEKPSLDGAEIQSPTASPASTAALAQPLKFDVVSIRRNVSGSREMTRQSAANTDSVTMTNVPLALALFYAWQINDPNFIAGIPDWAWSERYDIVAKIDPSNLDVYHALTNRQRAAMFEAILAERLKLQAHHETKDRPVYALVAAKGGPKIKETHPGAAHPNTEKANPNAFQKGNTIFITGSNRITGEAATMSELAVSLSTRGFEVLGLGRPVIDKTSLTGKYDFVLQLPLPDTNTAAANSDDALQESAASLSNALQDQLGLKLQPSTAPMDALVIDHIERPSEN